METQLRRRIAIISADRTGIAGKAAIYKTAGRPCLRPQMRAASPHIEYIDPQGIHRAGGNARLFHTVVARMANCELVRLRQCPVKPECAAIAVPETKSRMYEYTERRSLQSFGALRPLLKGLPGRIRGEIGGGAGGLRHRQDHLLRPLVERVGAAAVPSAFAPAAERLPDRTANIADQRNARGRLATVQQGRSLPRREIHAAAQKKTVRLKSRTERFD